MSQQDQVTSLGDLSVSPMLPSSVYKLRPGLPGLVTSANITTNMGSPPT